MTLESWDIHLRMDHRRRSGYRLGRIIARQQLLKKIAGGRRSDSPIRMILKPSTRCNSRFEEDGLSVTVMRWQASKSCFVCSVCLFIKTGIATGSVHYGEAVNVCTTVGQRTKLNLTFSHDTFKGAKVSEH